MFVTTEMTLPLRMAVALLPDVSTCIGVVAQSVVFTKKLRNWR